MKTNLRALVPRFFEAPEPIRNGCRRGVVQAILGPNLLLARLFTDLGTTGPVVTLCASQLHRFSWVEPTEVPPEWNLQVTVRVGKG
jgi:hypothetical protein